MPSNLKPNVAAPRHTLLKGQCWVPQYEEQPGLPSPAPLLKVRCSCDLPPDHHYILYPERFEYPPLLAHIPIAFDLYSA
ncbi:hypothetical protein ACCO45_002509 [Purpureocillium lilacinum]|uniref:Uncharacterized protein n=1 Tax=Purpureocillium lilacinum TaxID=33203 RepID=A0ACC4EA35_PURLI